MKYYIRSVIMTVFAIAILLFSSCDFSENVVNKEETNGYEKDDTESESTNYPQNPPSGKDASVTVLLDAGHGFGDVGCTSEYLQGRYEFELTMDYTSRLAEKLREKGYTVILTHDGVSYPSESEIIKKADALGIAYDKNKFEVNDVFSAYERVIYSEVLHREVEIDLMLSIHVNANADTNTLERFEIDYCAEKEASEQTSFAFEAICNALEEKYPSRQLKKFADSWDMSFIVTKYNSMPSILFETGYATTPADAEFILSEEKRDELCTALAKGIEDYFLMIQKTK